MEALKKPEIFCSTRLSKVELHARATLAVPRRGTTTKVEGKKVSVIPANFLSWADQSQLCHLLTYDIREDEVPAGDEGPDFANCHVAVKVRGARFGDAGAKFSIAQAGKHRGEGGDEKTEDNGRPRPISGNLAGQDVDASAQRGAHPQGDEVQGGQTAGELRLFIGTV